MIDFSDLDANKIHGHEKERKTRNIDVVQFERLYYIIPISLVLLLVKDGYIYSIFLIIYWYISAIIRTKRQINREKSLEQYLNPTAFYLNELLSNDSIDPNEYVMLSHVLSEYKTVLRNIKYIEMNPVEHLTEVQKEIILSPYKEQLNLCKYDELSDFDKSMYDLGYVRKSKLWDESPPACKISNLLEIIAYCDQYNDYHPTRRQYEQS